MEVDCYSKAESDARYIQIGGPPSDPLLVNDVRANGADYLTLRGGALGIEFEASNGLAMADLSTSLFSIKDGINVLTKGRIFADSSLGIATAGSFQGGTVEPLLPTDQFLNLKAGTVSVRVTDASDNSLCTFAPAEVHTVATRLRVDDQLYIDDAIGTATGLVTNAISVRAQDTQLSITGGSNGTVVNGDLDIQGTMTGASIELNTELRAPTVRARPSDTFLTIRGGTTGMYLDGTVFTASTIQADPGLVSAPAWLTFVGGTTGIEQVCSLAQVRQNVVGDVEFKVLNEDATTGEAEGPGKRKRGAASSHEPDHQPAKSNWSLPGARCRANKRAVGGQLWPAEQFRHQHQSKPAAHTAGGSKNCFRRRGSEKLHSHRHTAARGPHWLHSPRDSYCWCVGAEACQHARKWAVRTGLLSTHMCSMGSL